MPPTPGILFRIDPDNLARLLDWTNGFESACRSRRVGVVGAAAAGNGKPGESSRESGGGRDL
jgi:hypothetical protein